ncbi:MAG: prolipoprotein diacylglyceryl transferase [Limisphaerales bacterium]
MKPALFLYPHISSYPVLLLLGFFFGWLLARARGARYVIARRDLDNITLILPLAGLFGARFFARLFYAKLPVLEALKVWEGDGLVFYGGFIFGVAATLIYGALKRLNLVSLADCLAPSVALGLAFGRVGCFLAGCCWGDVCVNSSHLATVTDTAAVQRIQTIPPISQSSWPFAVQFPKKSDIYKQHARLQLVDSSATQSLRVHPVQLYEAILAAALCAYLASRSAGRKPGDVSLLLLVGYALIRFGTEFLRADNKIYAFGMTFSQVVSVYILACSLILVAIRSIVLSRRPLAPTPDEAPRAEAITADQQL